MLAARWLNCILFWSVTLTTSSQGESSCNEDGDLRLVGGSNKLNGRVEVCFRGAWGTVCDDLWDDRDATVVCRQLGFSPLGARSIDEFTSNFGLASGPIHLDDVRCIGDEKFLVNCTTSGAFNHDCTHQEDAGVYCEAEGFSCENGDVRLADGQSEYEGRVEVCIDNKFSTVCDDGRWGEEEAAVVCQQLNFTTPEESDPVAVTGNDKGFPRGVGDTILSGLECTGSEPNLYACQHSGNTFSCNHLTDAGVLCPRPNATCDDHEIHLVNGYSPNEGRVEYCINGHWGTVCHLGWDEVAAQVACRQLGYSTEDVLPVNFGDFGTGTGLILISGLDCSGEEAMLADCLQDPLTDNQCHRTSAAGVICFDPNNTCSHGDMRLMDGESPNEGRLEVCYNNHWGTVCDDNFGAVEAALVCRELGFPSEGAVGLHGAYFGAGSGLILVDEISCTGNETSILECSHLGVGSSDCYHGEDVSVLCQNANASCTNGDVRLVNGTGPNSGRVEVCFNGIWGTVCDDSWDSDDAAVVCNQLNYTGAAVGLVRGYFGPGSGPIFLDDSQCNPVNHSMLIQCFDVEENIGTHNCDHSEDASVICSNEDTECGNGDVRLVGGASDTEGRVEVCLGGEWGTVCDNFWSNLDAVVVCRQLGFSIVDAEALQGGSFGQGTGPIFFSRVLCSGSEGVLGDCIHSAGSQTDCTHHQDAGVICPAGIPCGEGEVRLMGGQLSAEGRVEYCHDGVFGPVCHDSWDGTDAMVVCRQLGFNNGEGAIALPHLFFGFVTAPSFLSNVRCIGDETALRDCPSFIIQGQLFCPLFDQAAVLCQSENATQTCENGDLRLMGAGVDYEGQVEVCFNGRWGTVCDDDWDVDDATIVCRILGYDSSNLAIPTTTNFFDVDAGSQIILLDEVRCNGSESTILDCLSVEPGNHDCNHAQDAGVFCSVYNESFVCQTGEVRLVNGNSDNEGRAEVCINGRWGSMCDVRWGRREAAVVCRQLGLDPETAQGVRGSFFGASPLPTFFSNLGCRGDESDLTQCSSIGPGVACPSTRHAGVICTDFPLPTCTTGDVQLVGGEVASEGTVEVCVGEEWATICDEGWDRRDAAVICNQLGFEREGAIALKRAFLGIGSGSVVFTRVGCLGNESSLSECVMDTPLSCPHFRDAGVICTGNETLSCSAGVRLVEEFPSTITSRGRVEVCLHGRWGSVCDDLWGRQDARVVCSQLGFGESEENGVAYAVGGAVFGEGNGLILLDNVECNGDEENLFQCQAQALGVHNCDTLEDAGVHCPIPGQACQNGDVRLADGEREDLGRVEVCLSGQWNTICGYLWDNSSAQVVCRQLNFTNPERAAAIYATTVGSGRILSSSVQCQGEESMLADCPTASWPDTDTRYRCRLHNLDAGVDCNPFSGTCTTGDVRLVNGQAENEGRVEICFNNQWGTICDDHWDGREARVVCRQLGYSDTVEHVAVPEAFFGAGSNPIHLDDVSCTGEEERLEDCPRLPVGSHNCVELEDAGVVCTVNNSVCANGDVRLVSGSVSSEGRVEVCFGGRWGTVCGNGHWDDVDAAVVCGQLGFSRSGARATGALPFGRGVGLILLSQVLCRGNETRLVDCRARDPGVHDCEHAHDAGAICQEIEACSTDDVRLHLGVNPGEGVVEVCVRERWSTVCDTEAWDEAAAAVVCRQLGYQAEGAVPVRAGFFGFGTFEDSQVLFQDVANAMVSQIQCVGNESNWKDCQYNSSGDVPAQCLQFNQYVGVICQTGAEVNCVGGSVRLAGEEASAGSGSALAFQGDVQLCFNNVWTSWCFSNWDDRDAAVVCRQLGFTAPGRVYSSLGELQTEFRNSTLHGSLLCSGQESNFLSCRKSEGFGFCFPFYSYDIICPTENSVCENGDIRVVHSGDPAVGRVEVCLGEAWTSMCGQDWSDAGARVACRQLGYTNLEDARTVLVPPGTGPVHFSPICSGDEESILDCNRYTVQYHDFSCLQHFTDAGVICELSGNCSDGEVRLRNGTVPGEGRVEVCFGNLWGTVCDDSWGRSDAAVVCRQLGYNSTSDSIPLKDAFFGFGINPIHLDDMDCVGNESRLADCPHSGVGNHNCANQEDAGVICVGGSEVCAHGALRLVNSPLAGAGRVEICLGNRWGTVCNRRFDEVDAAVICRQLGYPTQGAMVTNSSVTGMGSGYIFLSNLDCFGDERSVLECHRAPAALNRCSHNQDVGVICVAETPAPVCSNYDVRLVDGATPREGTFQFCRRNTWRAVCDRRWTNNEAKVVCRQLGFPAEGAVALRGSFFGPDEDILQSTWIYCFAGDQTTIASCSRSNVRGCSRHSLAGVICTPENNTVCTPGEVRLTGGTTQYMGRVEVCHHNYWGLVCDDHWDGFDAEVVCSQLGFTSGGGALALANTFYIGNHTFFVLDDVACEGSESELLNCRARELNDHNCLISEVAGVLCPSPVSSCLNGDVRLVDGDATQGRVEMCFEGEWGSLCPGLVWSRRVAAVVCRQLGFNNTLNVINQYARDTEFGVGSGPITPASPSCSGQEATLAECGSFTGDSVCTHILDVAVRCIIASCTDGDVRLVNGATENEGRVEVCLNHIWGTVCRVGWDRNEVEVICRVLGYNQGGYPELSGLFGYGLSHIWLTDLRCTGSEMNLLECRRGSAGFQSCQHVDDVGAICIVDNPVCEQGAIRLVDGINSDILEGRVEVCFGGRYGTVCDDNWDNSDAAVVCRQLGFLSEGARAVLQSRFGLNENLPIFLDNVRCVGNETRLMNCPASNVGIHNCIHAEDAGVICKPKPCQTNSYRLVGGANMTGGMSGYVEVCIDEIWAAVCADDAFLTEGGVQGVCSSFGLDPMMAIPTPENTFPQLSSGDFSPDTFYSVSQNCSEAGNCSTITTSVTCLTGAAAVFCPAAVAPGSSDTECVTGAVRLAAGGGVPVDGGVAPTEGRVEVCLDNQWGTVCDDSWDHNSAAVVCRQLGLPVENAISLAFGGGSGPIWLDDVKCAGTESNLLSCPQSSFRHAHNCRHSEDAGVQCKGAEEPSVEPGKPSAKPSIKDTSSGDQVGGGSSSSSTSSMGIIIPLVVVIVILVAIVIVIVLAILLAIFIKSRRTGSPPSSLRFKNEEDTDTNNLVESDFLSKDDIPMEKKDLST